MLLAPIASFPFLHCYSSCIIPFPIATFLHGQPNQTALHVYMCCCLATKISECYSCCNLICTLLPLTTALGFEDWREVEDLLDRIASQTSGSHGKSAGTHTCTPLHPHLYWHCHACPLGSVYVEWLCMNCSDTVYH